MKNQTRQMIKDIIQENAVSFKDSTGKALYSKVAKKLEEQYKILSKNVFKSDNK